jgi:hypothetical protein
MRICASAQTELSLCKPAYGFDVVIIIIIIITIIMTTTNLCTLPVGSKK